MIKKNCFFAMFDIVGFSNLVKEKGSEGVYQLYSRAILPMIQRSAMPYSIIQKAENGDELEIPDPDSLRVSYGFFSDTIIFYSNDDSYDSFVKIVLTSIELLKSGFNGSKAPYRGSIGHGDIIVDGNGIIVGTSLIDAYKGEQSQMWSGCILTEKCEEFCSKKDFVKNFMSCFELAASQHEEPMKLRFRKTAKLFVRYTVPMQRKSDDKPVEYFERECFVLDWTHWIYLDAAEKSFYEGKTDHQKAIKGNTIAFEKWARENNKVQ